MKSEEYKDQLKDTLEQLIETLDDTYYTMRNELEDEILQRKEHNEKIDRETNMIFNKLTTDICEKLIKTKLPFRVRLFNKISWCGHGVESMGRIRIHFCFNNDNNCFRYSFSTKEIKELLKIKDSDL